METKLSQAEAFKMREKFQSELNEMAKVFVHTPLVIAALSTAGRSTYTGPEKFLTQPYRTSQESRWPFSFYPKVQV